MVPGLETEVRDHLVLVLLELLLLGPVLLGVAAFLLLAAALLLACGLLGGDLLLAGPALCGPRLLARLPLGLALLGGGLLALRLGLLPLGRGLLLGDARLLGRDAVRLALLLPHVPADLAAYRDNQQDDDEGRVGNNGTCSRGLLLGLSLTPELLELESSADSRHERNLSPLFSSCR